MVDRTFAAGGDPVDLGRRRSTTVDDGRLPSVEAVDPSGVVTQRLAARLDRVARLLDRMRHDPLGAPPPGLPELLDVARRARRDAGSLLLLAGVPERPAAARPLAAVLDEAVDATEEPMRVDVRSGPEATVAPEAAVELLHLVAELVDHVAAVHPGGRVEVAPRAEEPAGVVIEVRADGARYETGEAGGAAAAERIAQRSRCGIVLRLGPRGPAAARGPVAVVHCPEPGVTVARPRWSLPGEPRFADLPRHNGASRGNGAARVDGVADGGNGAAPRNGARDNGSGPATEFELADGTGEFEVPALAPSWEVEPSTPAPPVWEVEPPRPVSGTAHREPEPEPLDPTPSPERSFGPASYGSASLWDPLTDPLDPEPLGRGPAVNGRALSVNGSAAPPRREPVDELFGPFGDLPADHDAGIATPIFEAVASAWFRESPDEAAPADWESPMDSEWRAAAERAARAEPQASTRAGLPRRRPGGQLVPPRRSTAPDDDGTPADRVPDRVRDRLSTYQRGLREGRHRADTPDRDPGDVWNSGGR